MYQTLTISNVSFRTHVRCVMKSWWVTFCVMNSWRSRIHHERSYSGATCVCVCMCKICVRKKACVALNYKKLKPRIINWMNDTCHTKHYGHFTCRSLTVGEFQTSARSWLYPHIPFFASSWKLSWYKQFIDNQCGNQGKCSRRPQSC